MTRHAVVLMNLGGPDSPAAVRPFLYNLFKDPAIISLPAPFREDEYAMRQGESSDSEARMMAMPGQIGGYVSDPSGAMISNARVTITSGNGSSRSVSSDSM